jgi:hypothetical protein
VRRPIDVSAVGEKNSLMLRVGRQFSDYDSLRISDDPFDPGRRPDYRNHLFVRHSRA